MEGQLDCCNFSVRFLDLWARMGFPILGQLLVSFAISFLVLEGGRAQTAGFLAWGCGTGLLLPTLVELMLVWIPFPSGPGREGFGDSVRKL